MQGTQWVCAYIYTACCTDWVLPEFLLSIGKVGGVVGLFIPTFIITLIMLHLSVHLT